MNAVNMNIGTDAPSGVLSARSLECALYSVGAVKSEQSAKDPRLVSADFLHWKGRVSAWGGTWPGGHILCVVSDYSLVPGIETVDARQQKIWDRVSRSAYNLPSNFRNLYVRKQSESCSGEWASQLTDQEINSLKAKMSVPDLQWWQDAIAASYLDAIVEEKLNPSCEYPIKARVVGLQDVEYCKVFSDTDNAEAAISTLRAQAKWETLEALGFQYAG